MRYLVCIDTDKAYEIIEANEDEHILKPYAGIPPDQETAYIFSSMLRQHTEH